MTKYTLLSFIFILLFTSCSDGILRGHEEESEDGKTYLVIEKGSCDEYLLDDVIWTYSIGEKAEIQPGEHCLSCSENGQSVYSETCFFVK